MTRHGIFILLAMVFLLVFPVRAEEYQLWPLPETRPGHVLPLWRNINQLIVNIAQADSENPERAKHIKSLTTEEYNYMAPRNVLGKVNQFRILLDRLRRQQGMPGTATSRAGEGQQLEPRTVFINSLLVLDSLQEWEQKVYGRETDYDSYYRFKPVNGATPSTVYREVDLAIRRLRLFDG